MQTYRRSRIVVAVAALVALPVLLAAQPGAGRGGEQPATLNASGRATIRAVPDWATILVSIQINASNPAEAAESVTRNERAVVDTLTKLGVPRSRISSTAYGVSPARQMPGSQGVLGANYTARTMLTIQVTPLDRITAVTAAALSRGAALIGQPRFGVAAEDSLRKVAFNTAMANAQRQAEIVAVGAGGRLGRLRTLTSDDPTQQYDQWQNSYFPNDGPYDSGQKPPPEVVITAIVRGTWEIVLPPRTNVLPPPG